MDHCIQIGAAQDRPRLVRREGGGLLEDQHLGMVVNGEGLLRGVVVDGPAGELGIGGPRVYQFKTQLTGEQRAIVVARHWVALGHARNRAVEAVARQEDVVRLVQLIEELLALLLVVRVIEREIEAAIMLSLR